MFCHSESSLLLFIHTHKFGHHFHSVDHIFPCEFLKILDIWQRRFRFDFLNNFHFFASHPMDHILRCQPIPNHWHCPTCASIWPHSVGVWRYRIKCIGKCLFILLLTLQFSHPFSCLQFHAVSNLFGAATARRLSVNWFCLGLPLNLPGSCLHYYIEPKWMCVLACSNAF